MDRNFYQDILLVSILTIISLVILIIPAINLFPIISPITYIPYVLLLLFLPGYSLLAAENPLFIQNGLPKRVGLSILVSLIISVLLAILLTFTPLKIMNSFMIYIIAVFTLIVSIIALVKRKNYHFVHYIEPEEEKAPPKELEIEKITDNERPDLTKVTDKRDLKIEKADNPQVLKEKSKKDTEVPQTMVSSFKTDKVDKKEITIAPEPAPSDENLSKLIEKINAANQDVLSNSNQDFEKDKTSPTKKEKDVVANSKLDKPVKKPDEKVDDVSQAKVEKEPPHKKPTITNGPISPKPRQSRGFAYYDLILILILSLLSIIIIIWPFLSNPVLNGAMQLLLMLFLPGYAIIAVLYPGRKDLGGYIRPVLSFGISYFLTAVLGLLLNYTSLGNGLNNILLGLSVITLISLLPAFIARRSVEENTRFRMDFSRFGLPVGSRSFMGVALILLAVLFIATPAYNLITPAVHDANSYTEFYILGPGGNNITVYPSNLTSGETGTVQMVLVNHEMNSVSYQIKTYANGTVTDTINVTLKPGEKKVIPYNFTAGNRGTMKMEFQLYKLPDLNNIYLSSRFWLNIAEQLTDSNEDTTDDSTQDTSTDSSSDDSSTDNGYTDDSGL